MPLFRYFFILVKRKEVVNGFKETFGFSQSKHKINLWNRLLRGKLVIVSAENAGRV